MDPRGRPYGDDDMTVPRGTPGMPPANQAPGWGAPPPQGPGGWQPGPPTKPPRNWMWVVIAATVVIVIASVTVVVVAATGGDDSSNTASTSSSRPSTTKASVPKTTKSKTTEAPPPPPPPPATPIAPEALGGVLLTGPEAGAVLQVPNTKEGSIQNDLIGGSSPIPLACRSVWAPVHKETFDPTGFTSVARKNIREEPENAKSVVEGVLSYPDAQAAKAAVDQVVEAWRQCQYLEFSQPYMNENENIEWKSGVVGDTDGVFTMLIFSRSQLDSPQTSADPNCQRAITSARNVVVDLLACSRALGSEGYSMARDVVQKINAAP